MHEARLFIAASVVAAMSTLAAGAARAEPPGADELPQRLPLIETSIVEYRWVFLTPEWVVEPHVVAAHVYAPTWQARQIEFPSFEFTTEHRRVARVAEFECKYSDFWLPNACRTTWRDVYVDVPVPVVRRDTFPVDVPQWSWQDRRTTVDVPRLVWKQQTLIVSLPAVALSRSAP